MGPSPLPLLAPLLKEGRREQTTFAGGSLGHVQNLRTDHASTNRARGRTAARVVPRPARGSEAPPEGGRLVWGERLRKSGERKQNWHSRRVGAGKQACEGGVVPTDGRAASEPAKAGEVRVQRWRRRRLRRRWSAAKGGPRNARAAAAWRRLGRARRKEKNSGKTRRVNGRRGKRNDEGKEATTKKSVAGWRSEERRMEGKAEKEREGEGGARGEESKEGRERDGGERSSGREEARVAKGSRGTRGAGRSILTEERMLWNGKEQSSAKIVLAGPPPGWKSSSARSHHRPCPRSTPVFPIQGPLDGFPQTSPSARGTLSGLSGLGCSGSALLESPFRDSKSSLCVSFLSFFFSFFLRSA